ncbi:MAG: hypothetical protein FJ135_01465 [Deltaproteobacteria bacterium]|nr:hypothetical protein [Deltaproteobacteria bacterium]
MAERLLLSRLLGVLGGAVFVTAVWGLRNTVEPFATWFYAFAWWSYIVMADAVIYARQRESLLLNRTRELPKMATVSITCWLVFEGVNFSLGNWHYVGLPQELPWRWLGYALGFATVFPGLFQTRDLLGALGVFSQAKGPVREVGTSWLAPATIAGLVMFMLPLIWPRYTFPLIWLSFIFFLEPFCFLGGGKSLWADWRRGQRREIYLLLLAGLVCGVFWELWNFWAQAKWVYTLPFFQAGKIFEMPVLGYLGFLPFALECAIMYNFIRMLEERWLISPRARRRWLLGQALFWVTMFAALDHWTVRVMVSGFPFSVFG